MTAYVSSISSSGPAFLDDAIFDGISLPDNFDDLARAAGVQEGDLPAVRKASVRVAAHGRRDAAGTFLFSDDLGYLSNRMLDKEAFETFATAAFEYDVRYIRSFQRCSVALGSFRAEIIRLALSSTHIMRLLARTHDERAEILKRIAAGEKITAAQVKAWGTEAEPVVAPLEKPGLKGLLAVAQRTARGHGEVFSILTGKVLGRIEEELKPGKGGKRKAVQKAKLAADVRVNARLASNHLRHAICAIEGNSFGDTAFIELPSGSGWRGVLDVVTLLGRPDGEWPSKAELTTWLVETAVPALQWALGDASARKTVPDAEPNAEPVDDEVEDDAEELDADGQVETAAVVTAAEVEPAREAAATPVDLEAAAIGDPEARPATASRKAPTLSRPAFMRLEKGTEKTIAATLAGRPSIDRD